MNYVPPSRSPNVQATRDALLDALALTITEQTETDPGQVDRVALLEDRIQRLEAYLAEVSP